MMQGLLLKIVEDTLGSRKKLVTVLSAQTGKSKSTLYRVLANDVSLKMDAATKLADAHNIGCHFYDKSCGELWPKQVLKLKSMVPQEIRTYLHKLGDELQGATITEKTPLFLLAKHVPLFHAIRNPELLCFMLYDCLQQLGVVTYSCDDFAARYMGICRGIAGSPLAAWYIEQPSVEVWTTRTFDPILMSLDYHMERKAIRDPSFSQGIRQALLNLLNDFRTWVIQGYKAKGEEGGTFKLYHSYTDLPVHALLYCRQHRNRQLTAQTPFMHVLEDAFIVNGEESGWSQHNLLRRCHCLNTDSDIGRNRFFDSMEQQV